jgi:hypothetical protein
VQSKKLRELDKIFEVVDSLNNTWICGWKGKNGEIWDKETIQASGAAAARYRYVIDVLFRRYPALGSYRASSFVKLVYAGTSGKPPKSDISESEFFELVGKEKELVAR